MRATEQEEQDEILRRMEGAGRYNAWLLERMLPHLGPRVLDVGAGIGTFTEPIAAQVDSVLAAEPDTAFAERLRARVAHLDNVRVVPALVQDLPPEDTGFDAAVCMNVLEHIPDDVAALRSFRERLAPGGRLLILVPAHPFLYGATDEAVDHQRRYASGELRSRLASADFEILELRHVNPVGTLGWLVSSRILRRRLIPSGPLALYDRLVPALRLLDALRLPVGLSLWAVARRPG